MAARYHTDDKKEKTREVAVAPPKEWPEPIQRVQALSESGISQVPPRYVRSESVRSSIITIEEYDASASSGPNIPVIDIGGLEGEGREATVREIGKACREWGFFQVVNHGVPVPLLRRAREAFREFFHLPMEEKQKYANDPVTYEGYGSRLGVDKGATLDWGDYFFQHFWPLALRDVNKWPSKPTIFRECMAEYSNELQRLCRRLLRAFSTSLGLPEGALQEAFGGEEWGICMRSNYYPKCPQPNMTLGLSSHSDPGGLTVLLPDDKVRGLQVLKEGRWILIDSVPDAFVINVADQLQILSNGIFKSVEHRVVVNSKTERISLAMFCNPEGNKVVKPMDQLVTPARPCMYPAMTFNEYRLYIRMRGPLGKSQVDSICKDQDQPQPQPESESPSQSQSSFQQHKIPQPKGH